MLSPEGGGGRVNQRSSSPTCDEAGKYFSLPTSEPMALAVLSEPMLWLRSEWDSRSDPRPGLWDSRSDPRPGLWDSRSDLLS